MKRFGVLLLILCAFAGPALAIADEPKPQASLPQLEDEVMCPVCGTLLGLSHSPAAERERVFIRKLIAPTDTEALCCAA